MTTIWKYPLETVTNQTVRMPLGSKILTVQVQHAYPCLWAVVDEHTNVLTERIIYTLGRVTI